MSGASILEVWLDDPIALKCPDQRLTMSSFNSVRFIAVPLYGAWLQNEIGKGSPDYGLPSSGRWSPLTADKVRLRRTNGRPEGQSSDPGRWSGNWDLTKTRSG